MQAKLFFSSTGASLLLSALWLGEMPLYAQMQNGSLTGTISDPAGIRLAQAAVTVQNAETSGKAMTRLDGRGEYRFDNLPPGKYSIRAAAKGRTTVQINDVLIQANKIATVNVILSESKISAISVVQVSQAPEPVDVPVATPPVAPARLSQR